MYNTECRNIVAMGRSVKRLIPILAGGPMYAAPEVTWAARAASTEATSWCCGGLELNWGHCTCLYYKI